MYTFHSQNAEDAFVFSLLINQPRSDGTFLEIGGYDGVTYSNTKFFEDTLGFQGTLIEPTSQYNRLVQNRPNSRCIQAAIDTQVGEVIFIGEGPSAGVDNLMIESFKSFHHRGSSKYLVKTRPLYEIVNKENTPYIDLFSLDVEGSEKKVLETFDFTIPVYMFIIELDENNKEKDEDCREILRKNGFTFFSRVFANEYWVNHSYFRKDLLYKKPDVKPEISQLGLFPAVDTNYPFIQYTQDEINKLY